MRLFTIGFTNKTANQFFDLLTKSGVTHVIDTRLNNKSQLAGFSKGSDLPYFLARLTNISYRHAPELAPTKEILNAYRNRSMTWQEYAAEYIALLKSRDVAHSIAVTDLEHACLLCSEATAAKCHRRLAAEYLQEQNPQIEIIHL